jgi:uncharacterized protein YrrD
MKATELIGLPVVTLDGEDVAEVRDVVYEPNGGGLIGFTLNKRGFFSGRLRQALTIDGLRSIGPDAVVVDDDDTLVDRDEAPERVTAVPPDRDVIGASVITEDGTEIGHVSDVIVSLGAHAEAVGYQLSATGEDREIFIPLPEQISVSGDALLVPGDLAGFVRGDLTGFGGAVEEYRTAHGASPTPRDPREGGATKESLYEEAQELDVTGRSSMSKAELAEAVAERKERR